MKNLGGGKSFEKSKNSIEQNFGDLISQLDYKSVIDSTSIIEDLKSKNKIRAKTVVNIDDSNLFYSDKMNLYLHLDPVMKWVVVLDPNQGVVGIIDQEKNITYSDFKKMFSELSRKRDYQSQTIDKTTPTPENQSETYLRRHLNVKMLFRYGIKDTPNRKARSNEEYNSQVIAITDTGLIETVNSSLFYDGNYDNPEVQSNEKFIHHELVHSLAIPIIDFLFKDFAKYVHGLENDGGIFNQTYSRFYEIFVESLLFELLDQRNNANTVLFVYPTPFGKTLANHIVANLSPSDLLAIQKSIRIAGIKVKEKFKEVKTANAEAITTEFKEAALDKNLPKKALVTAAIFVDKLKASLAKDTKTNKSETIDEKPEVSNEFEAYFDYSQYSSLVELLMNFDMGSFTMELYRTSIDLFNTARLWEKEGGDLTKAPKDFTHVESNGKPYQISYLVAESFKFWLASLSTKDRNLAIKSIVDTIPSEKSRLIEHDHVTPSDIYDRSQGLLLFLNECFDTSKPITFDNYQALLNDKSVLNKPDKRITEVRDRDDHDYGIEGMFF
jgi:hypothetical protein